MAAEPLTEEALAPPPTQKTRGEALEGIAFTFCKAGTILLLLRLVLPPQYHLTAVAALAAGFFLAAYAAGERSSRCILRKPLWIAAFWALVCVGTLLPHFRSGSW
ncbi:MAG: hypothetical protein ACK47B_14935 [Armatimonadota bacterium]